ncbi:SEP domain protein [Theileria parva strain Muguga]|uniref:SEP domain protein n=1 Tax=Theileria parva strain Muguga TaxID=333668 RepID=UPI001C622715|nr:SEP domain protein [Theileria parva strain Muguga]EAN31035.2 SEP domain protein [Theileria parva strain Muguga]
MTNIRSLDDYMESREGVQYSYAGGHNSAIGIDEGEHVVNLYLDGFIVDGGPFRPLSDPNNAVFIADVKRGIAPPELQHGTNDINLHLIEHNNYYNNNVNSNKVTGGTKVSNLEYRTGERNTNLRIKLSTGDLINLTISQDATIQDLKQFIKTHMNRVDSSSVGGSTGERGLLYGFPPKKINFEDTTTLKEADILNCNIIQK